MIGAINIRPRASTAVTKKTRHAAWLEILESQLRVPPNADTCFAISHTKPIKVTVNNDLIISFSPLKLGAHRYNVRHIENVAPKDKLLVCVNPYAAPAINIIITKDNGAERFVSVEPMNSHAGGYYENAPILEITTLNLVVAAEHDFLTPLNIGNLMNRCLNVCAAIHAPIITKGIVGRK